MTSASANAFQYMSGQVSRIYASIQVINTDGNNGGRGGGRFGGRGCGRDNGHGHGRGHCGGRGRGGRHGGRGGHQQQQRFFGNVDVTDPTRTFTADEYNELLQNNHWFAVLAMRSNQRQQQQQQQQQQPTPDRGSQNGSGFGSGAYCNN